MHSDYENLEKMRDEKIIFFGKKNDVTSPYYLSVSPAVTRLTVYRRLQVRIGSPSSRFDYGPIVEFRVVFSKNLDFLCISNPVSDFRGLKMINAEAHARGFAPLWPVC